MGRERVTVLVCCILLTRAGLVIAAPIHGIASKGDLVKLETLVKSNPHLVNAVDKDGSSPLHYATASGHSAAVCLLLDYRADVNSRKKNGVTPLHVAASLGFKEIAELLIAAGADINAADALGRTPLSLAAGKGHAELASLLTQCSTSTEPIDITDPGSWQSPDWGGRPGILRLDSGGFVLRLPAGYAWAAITKTVPVDLDTTPVLAVSVSSVAPGAHWVLKLDNKPYDPTHPFDVQPTPAGGHKPGLYFADLRELGGWHGKQNIEIRLFVVGPNGANVTFSRVSLLPVPTPSNSLPTSGELCLRTGLWRLNSSKNVDKLVLSRFGALGQVTAALPMGTQVISRQIKRKKESTTAVIRSASDWAKFETRLTAYHRPKGLFRWSVDVELAKPHSINSGTPECRYTLAPSLKSSIRKALPASEFVYVLASHRLEQEGFETGNAYSAYDAAMGGGFLYFQDFSTLNDYYQATHTSPKQSVKAGLDGFGYALPADPTNTLPAGSRVRLIDSYLALDDFALQPRSAAIGPLEECRIYLELLSRVYDIIPHPDTVYTDWQEVARKMLVDLDTPDSWCNRERGYIRNYVNEPWTTNYAELLVQVEPFVSTLLYDRKYGTSSFVAQQIAKSLPEFYLPEIRCIRDSNISVHPTSGDSWYRLFELVQLARAAKMGLSDAKGLVKDSLDSTIELAHKCKYAFPVAYNPMTLDPVSGSEPDSTGTYAYLMLQAYELFNDKRYIEEARTALGHVAHYGMRYSYELHLTALTAAACARMWKLTGDEQYLTISLVPVSNLMRHCWIWDCRSIDTRYAGCYKV